MALQLPPNQPMASRAAKLAGGSSGQLPMTEAKMIQLLQRFQQQDLHSSDRSAPVIRDWLCLLPDMADRFPIASVPGLPYLRTSFS